MDTNVLAATEHKPATNGGHRLTPRHLLVALSVCEGFLLLSDQLGWPEWHKGYAVLAAIACVVVTGMLELLWLALAFFFRWRFQFSVRSLLVFAVLVAIPFSWLASEIKRAKNQRETVESIGKRAGRVYYAENAQLTIPTCLWRLFGDDFFTDVAGVSLFNNQVTDVDVEHVKTLTRLRSLTLDNTQVTDSGLGHLRGLSNLHDLSLSDTQVTDAGIEHLRGMLRLKELNLDNTKVTDAGLGHLRGLPQLQVLSLNRTRVTDAGLEHLRGLPKLTGLSLDKTRVTDRGLKRLEELAQLQCVSLNGTRVTDKGVKEALQALPKRYFVFGGTILNQRELTIGGVEKTRQQDMGKARSK
jgi:hypothetical protein